MVSGVSLDRICGGAKVELPDVSPGCCYGSAVRGPQFCTCWDPVYDVEQTKPPLYGPPPVARAKMCDDCAMRPNSPERNGEKGFDNNSEDALEEMVRNGSPFFCHKGMRRIVKLVHRETGTEIESHSGDYDPPLVPGVVELEGTILRAEVPYKADGTVGDICAGWAAKRAAFVKAWEIELAEADERYPEHVS